MKGPTMVAVTFKLQSKRVYLSRANISHGVNKHPQMITFSLSFQIDRSLKSEYRYICAVESLFHRMGIQR